MGILIENTNIVTTMSYDMETAEDSNICTDIKEYLKNNLGWRDNIPEYTVLESGVKRTETDGDIPATTLWKVQIMPSEAIREFQLACEAYNINHASDGKMKFAKGKAFAVCNNRYDAIEIK